MQALGLAVVPEAQQARPVTDASAAGVVVADLRHELGAQPDLQLPAGAQRLGSALPRSPVS